MKNLQTWLSEYGESHQNPINKLIHWFCVPAIMVSIFGLLYAIPFFTEKHWYANWGAIILIPILFFYFRLSKILFFCFLIIGFLILILNQTIYQRLENNSVEMTFVHIVIFAIAWIFQFYGHKIEGKKPSFLKDIQFLLIGPAWLLSFVFTKFGIEL